MIDLDDIVRGKIILSEPKKLAEFATTEIPLPKKTGYKLLEWSRSSIDPNDLYGEGLETRPHITVLYGIHHKGRGTIYDTQDLVYREFNSPVKYSLGGVGFFKGGRDKEFDVLYLRINGRPIRDLHDCIKDNISNSFSYPNYTPHMTLAYLKLGSADKYKDLLIPSTRPSYTSNWIHYSDLERKKHKIMLV